METVGDITGGGLHIRDHGYIAPTYLLAVAAKKASSLNRLPAMAGVYTMDGRAELGILVYEKAKVPCRHVRRSGKSKGVGMLVFFKRSLGFAATLYVWYCSKSSR